MQTMNFGALTLSNIRGSSQFAKDDSVTINTDIGGLYGRTGVVAYVKPSGDVALTVAGCLNYQVFRTTFTSKDYMMCPFFYIAVTIAVVFVAMVVGAGLAVVWLQLTTDDTMQPRKHPWRR